ncbi:hypothetical protein [Acidomonas methanolica]|nr:hypothetical protein [Acidomonas methanolica]
MIGSRSEEASDDPARATLKASGVWGTMAVQVTAADVSLYHVAAVQLGDATQWWRIAQLNGMTDPDLTVLAAPVFLEMPPVSTVLTTGLPERSA